MSATVLRKRLEDALIAGHKIEKEQRSDQHLKKKSFDSNHLSKISFVKTHSVNVGDENGVYSIALNGEGTLVAIGLGTGYFQLINSSTREKIRKFRTGLVQSVPLLALKFHPSTSLNVVYTGGSDGFIKAWNLETYTHGETVEESGNEITALDFSNNGSCFVTAGKDTCVRLYDSETLGLSRVYNGTKFTDVVESIEDTPLTPGHSQKVFALKFNPEDTNVFLSASWDHTIKVWDKRTENAVRTIHGPYICGDGLDMHAGKILTASWLAHDALQLWDYSSGNLIESIPFKSDSMRGEFLYCGRFWDPTHVVAGGSGTDDLKLINLLNHEIVDCIDGENRTVQAVEVKEQKNFLICGTSGNLLKFASVS